MTVSRRKFITAGALGLGGLIIAERTFSFLSESKVKAKIVIVGGGSAGITMAAYLSDKLRHDDITIIEPNEIHHYQPGYTLIASGVFTPEEILKPTEKLIPRNVKWMKDRVVELNPDNNVVVTAKNGRVRYDFLVLVPGCITDFNQIEGLSKESLGEGNIHSLYDFEGSKKCHEALKKLPAIFGDRLQKLYDERGIATHYKHRLVSVDPAAKKAVFQQLEEPTQAKLPITGETKLITVDFDFLHVTPPMGTPDFVRNSPFAITEGELRHGGWAKVNNETLINQDYPNVVILGDVAGLGTSKTGAAIRMQAPVAAANLVSIMEGKEPGEKYDGYSACPIVTEYGKVLMCEFGYEKELMPIIPFIDPGVERGMWWILKVHGLKPMYYYGMLKGLM
jgi:sulfide:quinone oxidoreductase